MSIIEETEQELNTLLDEGVRIRLLDVQGGDYQLQVLVEDAACAECLVPDQTLSMIATDALTRRGAQVSSVSVLHG